MIWDNIRFIFMFLTGVLITTALLPVAVSGGFFATKYIYCDQMQLCKEIKK